MRASDYKPGDRIAYGGIDRIGNVRRLVWGTVVPRREARKGSSFYEYNRDQVWAKWGDGSYGFLWVSQITEHHPPATPFQQRVQEYLCRSR